MQGDDGKDAQILIVISNYNKEAELRECLPTLHTSIKHDGANVDRYRAFLTDSHSNDESWEVMDKFRKSHSNITQLTLMNDVGAVRGFGRSVFNGLRRYPGAESVITIDSDAVVSPGFLKALSKKTNQSGSIGMYATNQYDRKQSEIHSSTGHYVTISGGALDRDYCDKPNTHGKSILCPCFSGAMYSVRMLKQVRMIRGGGRTNHPYSHYYGCPELGFRAQLKGWDVEFVAEARMLHHRASPDEIEGTQKPNMEISRALNIMRFFPSCEVEKSLARCFEDQHAHDKKERIAEARRFLKTDEVTRLGTFSEEAKLKLFERLVQVNGE